LGDASPPIDMEGWRGWDEYAPFYDWENAQTLGNRDVAFWRDLTREAPGPVLELGSGTGRISVPLARAGVDMVGVDRSAPMLSRARRRARRVNSSRGLEDRGRVAFVRADIRALPFKVRQFDVVLAPYGVLQSLIREDDLTATLASVAATMRKGGLFAIDLVPDVPRWREYRNRAQLRGRSGGRRLTLIESVRQDRARRLTIFEQRYLERINGRAIEHRFDLVFRTLSVRQMTRRLESAGFVTTKLIGDYEGGRWNEAADIWIILAKKV
jgi:SAM-dependent methyltransferase